MMMKKVMGIVWAIICLAAISMEAFIQTLGDNLRPISERRNYIQHFEILMLIML